MESDETGGKIGGEGLVVEVDETKIGRRKYNRGRLVDGVWVFGMCERGTGRLRIEVCPENKRDKKTLLSLLQKYVHPGTLIMSDCWRGYSGLQEAGYQHQTVNHSKFYVDPVTGAHTQQIESNWRAMKRRLSRGGIKQGDLGLHFGEFIWFQKNKDDVFTSFVSDLAKMNHIWDE